MTDGGNKAPRKPPAALGGIDRTAEVELAIAGEDGGVEEEDHGWPLHRCHSGRGLPACPLEPVGLRTILLRERGCRPDFALEFVKYVQYAHHSSAKSVSTPRPLATDTIVRQAPIKHTLTKAPSGRA